MRSLGIKVAMGLLVLATVFVATPVLAQPMLELLVRGRGMVDGAVMDCTATVPGFSTGCNLHTFGEIVATHLGLGTFTVQIRTGSGAETNFDGGKCFPANRSDVDDVVYDVQIATLTAANGDTITFNTVGKLCQELGSGSSLQYIADYRITGGSSPGRFADAVGGGTLALTVNTSTTPKEVFLHMHGNIRY